MLTLSFMGATYQLIDTILEPAVDSRCYVLAVPEVDQEAKKHKVDYNNRCSHCDCKDKSKEVYISTQVQLLAQFVALFC